MIGEYCLTVHQCILADIDPAMGKMDIQNESATFIFSYILCYILVLLAQKKPYKYLYTLSFTCIFFLFFFNFFYKIHTNMYVFGFHKADTCTQK